jgi:hypothetical protein
VRIREVVTEHRKEGTNQALFRCLFVTPHVVGEILDALDVSLYLFPQVCHVELRMPLRRKPRGGDLPCAKDKYSGYRSAGSTAADVRRSGTAFGIKQAPLMPRGSGARPPSQVQKTLAWAEG